MIYPINHLPEVIPVGVQTEQGVEVIGFDLKPWLDALPDMDFSVWHTRPGENEAYPVNDHMMIGTVLYWHPDGYDTAIAGDGKVEIAGVGDNQRKLSGFVATSIRVTSLVATKEPGENAAPWYEAVLQAAQDIKVDVDVGESGLFLVRAVGPEEYAPTTDRTIDEIRAAVAEGKTVFAIDKEGVVYSYAGDYGEYANDEPCPKFFSHIKYSYGKLQYRGAEIRADNRLNGIGNTGMKTPAPYALNIAGKTYDGSKAVSVLPPPSDASSAAYLRWNGTGYAPATVDSVKAELGAGGTVEVDVTLTQSGKAADAKAVGDRFTALSEEMAEFEGDLGIIKGDTSTVNIKTYGAIGDGMTDDTEAIAAAIAACRYGGSVFVPEGTYIVSDIALKSDMRIYGIGDASIIKFADGVTAINNSCIRADNVENVRVENLQLDGNSANNSMQVFQGDGGFDCIHVGGSSNVVIDSVNGHHAGYHGIIITESDNITVQNCIFHHNGFRPIHGLKNVTTIKILNNECYSNGQGFEGEPNKYDGIFFFNASRDILIRGNYVHDVYNVGAIVIGGATEASFSPSSNVRIEDNTIVTWPTLPTNLNTPGIYIIGDDVSDIRITGNTIRNSYNGIFLHNAKSGAKNSGIFIHNNLIENGQQYAIRLNHGNADGAYEDIVVTENTLINYGDNIGVECNNTKKVYIAHNIFSGKTGGNSFAGIWGLGATEVIAESNFFVPRTGTLSHAVKFDNASKDCYFINNYVHTGQVTNDSVNGITERNLPSAD